MHLFKRLVLGGLLSLGCFGACPLWAIGGVDDYDEALGGPEVLKLFYAQMAISSDLSEEDRAMAQAFQSLLSVCAFWKQVERTFRQAQEAHCLPEVLSVARGQAPAAGYLISVLGPLFGGRRYTLCEGVRHWQSRARQLQQCGYDAPEALARVLTAADPIPAAQAVLQEQNPAEVYAWAASFRIFLLKRYESYFLERAERQATRLRREPRQADRLLNGYGANQGYGVDPFRSSTAMSSASGGGWPAARL